MTNKTAVGDRPDKSFKDWMIELLDKFLYCQNPDSIDSVGAAMEVIERAKKEYGSFITADLNYGSKEVASATWCPDRLALFHDIAMGRKGIEGKGEDE